MDLKARAKDLLERFKASRKAQRVAVHAGAAAAMALGIQLTHGLLPFQSELVKLTAAMLLGAYTLKPVADWACRKMLDE